MAGAPVDGIVHPPAALLHANAAPLRVSQQPPLGCSLGNVLGQDDVTARRRERACELTCSSSSEHATDARARAGVRGAGAAPVLEVVVRILLRVLDLLAHGGTRRRLSGSNRATFLLQPKGGKQINYPAVGQSFLTERLGISLTRRPPTPPDRPSHQDRRGAPAFFKHPRLVCRAYPSRSVDYEFGTNDGEDRGSSPRCVTAVVWLVYNSRHNPTALKPQ